MEEKAEAVKPKKRAFIEYDMAEDDLIQDGPGLNPNAFENQLNEDAYFLEGADQSMGKDSQNKMDSHDAIQGYELLEELFGTDQMSNQEKRLDKLDEQK